MRWSFPLKQRRCCSIAFFQRIGPLPCCWLDSVVAWGASGPGLSSSTVAYRASLCFCVGFLLLLPCTFAVRGVCAGAQRTNADRISFLVLPAAGLCKCACVGTRKELVQGQKRMAGARTIRNLFSISLWLILPQSICEIIDLALPCIPNMLSLLGSS